MLLRQVENASKFNTNSPTRGKPEKMTPTQISRAVKASIEAHGIYVTANKIGITHSTLTRFMAGMHCQGHVVERIGVFAAKPLGKVVAKPVKKSKSKKAAKPKAKKVVKKKAVKKAKPAKAKKPTKKKASKKSARVRAPRKAKAPPAPASTPAVEAAPEAAE
jgi:hypothetical protein